MLFKSVLEYEPDAGSDDAPEAVAEAAPTSEARQRLQKLLSERDGAAAEMRAIQASIAKLHSMQSVVPPLVERLAVVQSADAERYRLWSKLSGDDAPAPA